MQAQCLRGPHAKGQAKTGHQHKEAAECAIHHIPQHHALHLSLPHPPSQHAFTSTSHNPMPTLAHKTTLCSTLPNSPTIHHTGPKQARGTKTIHIHMP